MTSPYLSFFLALDNLPRLDASVLADRLGRDYQQFLQRRWVVPAGHLTHVMVPFLDSEQEVEIDVDEDAGRYSYCSPLNGRTIVQPLAGIALYSIQMDSWLADLAALIGIEERRRSNQICRTPNHLWHLGEQRIAGTHDFAPVFVARAWSRAPQDKITAVLADAVWPRGGVVLCPRRTEGGQVMMDFNSSSSIAGQVTALVDAGLQQARARQSERQYLGASRLGVACERALQFEYAKAPIDHGREPKPRRYWDFQTRRW